MIDTEERTNIKQVIIPSPSLGQSIDIPLLDDSIELNQYNGIDLNKLLDLVPSLEENYRETIFYWIRQDNMSSLRAENILKRGDVEIYLNSDTGLDVAWGAHANATSIVENFRNLGKTPSLEDYEKISESFLKAAELYGNRRADPNFALTEDRLKTLATQPQVFVWLTEILKYKESTLPSPGTKEDPMVSNQVPQVPQTRKY